MYRRLRNSLNALVVTAALCTTGAFAAASIPFTSTAPTVSSPAVAVAVGARHKPSHTNRIRHALAMPYFSFLPRG
ncbi:hypothetical protein [Lysobacter claricitrinus]|uniref:hypothetical protein n=1 Tax=Lysobacter claricitrinus TaxID=3367728 RepID=UPI0037DB1CC2